MGPFIDMAPEAVTAASLATAGLAAESFGHVGQAAAVAAVVPPGLDVDTSPANVAKIMGYATEVAALLAASGALQELYSVANGASSTLTSFTDLFAAAGVVSAFV